MAETEPIKRVRCYSCGHEYAARTDSLDTACPKCGSKDYTRVRSVTTHKPCRRCAHASSLHPAVLGGSPGCSGAGGKCGCSRFSPAKSTGTDS